LPIEGLALLQASGPESDQSPPCHRCTARCCKYVALEIDRPTTPKDYDQVRWFLLHEGIVVWVQEGDWYLEMQSRCRHLQPDNSCGIYETRPDLCREYGLPELGGPCEFFSDGTEYELYFDSAEKFEAWMKVEMARRARRLERRRERYREKRTKPSAGLGEAIA
jgi:Fe-S-cluster containining protein